MRDGNDLTNWMYPDPGNSYTPGVDRDVYDLRHWMYPNQGLPEFPDEKYSYDDLRDSDVGIAIHGQAVQEQEALGQYARDEWDNTWADYGAEPGWNQ